MRDLRNSRSRRKSNRIYINTENEVGPSTSQEYNENDLFIGIAHILLDFVKIRY